MNIELDEVVALDVSDDALELAAGSTQGGPHAQGGPTYGRSSYKGGACGC
jgi:hypothetical protein